MWVVLNQLTWTESGRFLFVKETVAASEPSHLIADEAEEGGAQQGAFHAALRHSSDEQIHVVDVPVNLFHCVHHLLTAQHKSKLLLTDFNQNGPIERQLKGMKNELRQLWWYRPNRSIVQLDLYHKAPCNRCKVVDRDLFRAGCSTLSDPSRIRFCPGTTCSWSTPIHPSIKPTNQSINQSNIY